jgi:VWFA-related protein
MERRNILLPGEARNATMAGVRLIPKSFICLAAFALSAQTPAPETLPPDFRTGVTEIVVPLTVHDRDGNIVNGLQPREFHVTDNGKEQNIAVDVEYHPISLALVIQANGAIDAILPQVKKIGSLLETLVVGDQGEVAVASFDHRFPLKQDFTTDLPKISEALKKITAGSSTSALIDAMDLGIRMLRNRPKNRRRVMLVIAETRDQAVKERCARLCSMRNSPT